MAKRIYKYPLLPKYDPDSSNAICVLEHPAGAEALTVAAQDDQICLWAIVDSDVEEMETSRFLVIPTGGEFSHPDAEFIKTVFMGPLVFHVFLLAE